MNIKSHGTWARYTPAKFPEGAPPNALFSRRVSDGVDWYDYVNSGENFARDSIKMTVREGKFVGAATVDPTMLFPGDDLILEVTGVSMTGPQKEFGGKMATNAADRQVFTAPLPVPEPPDRVADLLKRLEALEAKGT